MKWSEAVRKWNESRGWHPTIKSQVKWITPKRGSTEYDEVKKLMEGVMEAAKSVAAVPPPPLIPQPMMLSGTVSSLPATLATEIRLPPVVTMIPNLIRYRQSVSLQSPVTLPVTDFLLDIDTDVKTKKDSYGNDIEVMSTNDILTTIKKWKQKYEDDTVSNRNYLKTFESWIKTNSVLLSDRTRGFPLRLMREFYNS